MAKIFTDSSPLIPICSHAAFRAVSLGSGYFSHKVFQRAASFLLLSLTSGTIAVLRRESRHHRHNATKIIAMITAPLFIFDWVGKRCDKSDSPLEKARSQADLPL